MLVAWKLRKNPKHIQKRLHMGVKLPLYLMKFLTVSHCASMGRWFFYKSLYVQRTSLLHLITIVPPISNSFYVLNDFLFPNPQCTNPIGMNCTSENHLKKLKTIWTVMVKISEIFSIFFETEIIIIYICIIVGWKYLYFKNFFGVAIKYAFLLKKTRFRDWVMRRGYYDCINT